MSNNVLRIIHYFGWRKLAIAVACAATVITLSGHARAATPAGCAALQAKYPDLKGKTLVNAINPHTPGYEALDPKDPEQVHRASTSIWASARRLPRLQADLQAGRLRRAADHAAERPGRHRHLRHLCDEGARQGRRFHHLFESVRRRSGRQGQSEAHHRHQHARCAAMPRRKTPASSKCRWSRTWPQPCKAAGQARADTAALRQQRRLHPGDPRRPRRHLCQRRQHRGPGGQGLSGQAGARRSRSRCPTRSASPFPRTSPPSATPSWPR